WWTLETPAELREGAPDLSHELATNGVGSARAAPGSALRTHRNRRVLMSSLQKSSFAVSASVGLLALAGCGGVPDASEASSVGVTAEASNPHQPNGETLFDNAFPGTNGRSCA